MSRTPRVRTQPNPTQPREEPGRRNWSVASTRSTGTRSGAVVTRPRRRLDGLEPEVEALHARLLDGDPLAPYALCGLLLRPLKQWA
jgi:hypothetical protein